MNALGGTELDGFPEFVVAPVGEDFVCVLVALADLAEESEEFGDGKGRKGRKQS